MLRLLKFILLLILVVGASIGGTIWFTGMKFSSGANASTEDAAEQAPEPPPPPVAAAPIFAELEPFTVTLYGESRNRILYTAITLRMENEASQKLIQEYMPAVRDRIIKVLSAQQLAAVQTSEGRQKLADNLISALVRPFAAQMHGPKVAEVLFTAFVVQ